MILVNLLKRYSELMVDSLWEARTWSFRHAIQYKEAIDQQGNSVP